MTTIYALDRPIKSVSEVCNVAVDFTDLLDSGELLTGTPTIVEVTTTALTLSDKAVSTAALIINGRTVIIGAALQFKVVGGAAGTEYEIRLTCATNSTPAQTRIARIKLLVVAD